MKKLIALVLSLVLMLNMVGTAVSESEEDLPDFAVDDDFDFESLDDPALLPYMEDTVYAGLVAALDSDEYFVENVKAVYISQEYLDELAYNSRANIFFGYTLAELNEQFQGEKYVFTLGDNNETVVEPWKDYDDTYQRALLNVAIGAGIILICVTVSIVSYGAGAPAVSMIFAVAAKEGTAVAVSKGVITGVAAGVVKGIQTGDMNEALKAAALEGSEAFKLGAICGAVSGGASEAIALKGATLNGLKMNQAAMIQKESKLPLSFIKNFHSIEEYNIYKNAGLSYVRINRTWAFSRHIDLDSVITDCYGKTKTNAQRILDGFSPVDANGIPYELHHIGQRPDSPLAILTKAEHMQGGNKSILHYQAESTVEHGSDWSKQVSKFWQDYLSIYGVGD